MSVSLRQAEAAFFFRMPPVRVRVPRLIRGGAVALHDPVAASWERQVGGR